MDPRRNGRVAVAALALALGLAAACSSAVDPPGADQQAATDDQDRTEPTAADTSTTTGATTSTTTATTTTAGVDRTEPVRQRLVISAAGDTSMDADYIPTFRTEGYQHAFTGLDGAFLDDDLTIVNLECAAATTGAPVKRVFNFNCELEALPVLRRAGVEVVNLANNHSADWGLDALLETKRNTIDAGLVPVGVGADVDEASTAAYFEIGGWTVAVLGFNAVIPGESWVAGPDHPGAADGRDAQLMAAAVAAADRRADLVLVTVHWGRELELTPLERDVESARAMIDAGADAIFGHHPHRLQALELIDGKPVAWSLGNFVWPRLSVAGATSAIARVTVEPDGSIDACLVPVDIESHGHPVIQDVEPGADDTTCRR